MTLAPAAGGNTNDSELGEEYEVDVVYPPQHTGSGFCWEPRCPDKEDQDLIGQLNQAVQDGLVSTQEADHIYRGKTI